MTTGAAMLPSMDLSDQNLQHHVALEKLSYMHRFAKSSTSATIVAPLLTIPLYATKSGPLALYLWLFMMTLAVVVRIFLIRSINLNNPESGFRKLNWGVGLVTLVWGLGWLMLVPVVDPVNYLLYRLISLTVLFVGMVGYCVNWKTFFSFVIPLELPELVFVILNHEFIFWPIALGSIVAFYLALKMGVLFSQSWEKSIALRYRNEELFNQLVAEKDAATAANIAKSDFIATASHDLRQPMQAINIFMEMISPQSLKDAERLLFERMRLSINLLNDMFNTLLNISKFDANAVSVVEESFDLNSLLMEVRESFADLAANKDLKLLFSGDHYQVRGDRALLAQILRNLLSNAIYYTDAGTVEVSVLALEQKLVLVVRDTGCGISEEDLPFIYKEFFRAQTTRSKHDGLGLGLSIVHRIVQMIGGVLEVQSHVGLGTRFTLKTPFPVNRLQGEPLLVPGVDPTSMDLAERFESKHLGLIENDPALLKAYQ